MTPDARVQAQQYYHAAGRDMEADLAALAAHPQGVVLLMPQLEHRFPETDAWYVHLLVGDVALARRLAAALPPQHWLCFQRGLRHERPHRLPWAGFLRKH